MRRIALSLALLLGSSIAAPAFAAPQYRYRFDDRFERDQVRAERRIALAEARSARRIALEEARAARRIAQADARRDRALRVKLHNHWKLQDRAALKFKRDLDRKQRIEDRKLERELRRDRTLIRRNRII